MAGRSGIRSTRHGTVIAFGSRTERVPCSTKPYVVSGLARPPTMMLSPSSRVDLLNAQYDLRTAELRRSWSSWRGDDRQGGERHRQHPPRVAGQPRTSTRRCSGSSTPGGVRAAALLAHVDGDAGQGTHGDLGRRRAAGDQPPPRREHQRRRAPERSLDHLQRMQEELVADGALVVKLWFHLPRAEHRAALEEGEEEPEGGLAGRRARLAGVRAARGSATPLIERFLRQTELPGAPWSRRRRHLVALTEPDDGPAAPRRRRRLRSPSTRPKDTACAAGAAPSRPARRVEPHRARQDRPRCNDRQGRV